VWAASLPKGIHDDRYRRLIERLTEARKSAGLSQVALAERLGKPQQFVSRYEVGERRLDVFEYIDVAQAIGIDGVGEIKAVIRQGR